MSRRACALAGVVIAMILWGSTFVVTKAAVQEIPPLTLTCLRFLVAAAVLLPIAALRGGLRRLPQPLPVAALVLMGLTGVAIFHVAFTYAMVFVRIHGAHVCQGSIARVSRHLTQVEGDARGRPGQRRATLGNGGSILLTENFGQPAGEEREALDSFRAL